MKKERALKRFAALTLVSSIVVSCGFFSPRDTEPPDAGVTLDALNLSAILTGTNYQFKTPSYEDVFHADAQYENINTGAFSRNQLIPRLQQVQRQLADQSMRVDWSEGEIIPRNDTSVYINSIKYKVPNDSGRSTFLIIRDKEWRIFQWWDSPLEKGKSLFSP